MPKIEVYYSSATGDRIVKSNQTSLRYLLEGKKLEFKAHDMAQLEKEERDKIYDTAAIRELPLLFVDDKFIGVRFI
jgi:hypothetical protein